MFIIAVFGGQKTGKGPWRPESKVRTLALFGGIDMDFREAQLPEGGTRITSWTLFGGTRVVAPKGMPVSVSGLSLLGGT
ncbi:MAG: DUF1707 and DUF2154 domain-containing protein, partial [Chloroflexi bacterium]|nr:DUF1707 and DUF2154 domain-containing protein [Chloroflexota bacterium]